MTGLFRMPILTVTAPSTLDVDEVSLLAYLTTALGGDRLHMAVGIRPPDPNHKPTLQLFDDAGRPRGYAKIGWNPATRALVRTEAAALTALPRDPDDDAYPAAARLLAAVQWSGQEVAVIEPLPAATHALPTNTPPLLPAILAIARRGGAAAVPRPFGTSSYTDRLRSRARSIEIATGAGDDAATVRSRIVDVVDRLANRYGDVNLEFGDWHGDWVPWNLGRAHGELTVWDWEHSGPDVPLGFDLAHEGFNVALTLRGESAEASADAATALVRAHGAGLGLDDETGALVVDAYLAELWLRTATLAAGGAGWNDALHPSLLGILERRLTPAG